MGNRLNLSLPQKKIEEKSLDLCPVSQLKTYSIRKQQVPDAEEAEDRLSSMPDDIVLNSWKQYSSRKQQVPQAEAEAEDRLSLMPDDIVLHILSFLPLKEMGKASLLSRRYTNLWTLTPVLHFHEPYSLDLAKNRKLRYAFVNWVNNVLGLHKGSSLKEFKIVLNYNNQFFPHHKTIDAWLEFALRRNVQHLELELMSLGYLECVPSVNHVYPVDGRKADSYRGLKCLKSLSLKDVVIDDETINFLLRNSPFLERLEVAGMNELGSLVISGPHSALRYLHIKWWMPLHSISISNLNLVSLNISSVGNLTLTDLPMLDDLCISETSFETSRTLSLASACHYQLKVLTLQGLEMKELTRLSNLFRLTKLRLLVLEIQARSDKSLTKLISVINSCPRLEKFVLMLHCVRSQTKAIETMIEFDESSPSLQNRTLKVFEFVGYRGRVSDDELVLHIVESAVCLERIIIDLRSPVSLKDPCYSETKRQQEARWYALKEYEALKKSNMIPQHVHLVLR